MFGSVASVITCSCAGSPRPRSAAKSWLEDDRLLRGTALEQWIEILRARHDGDDAENAGGGKAIAHRQGHVVRRGIHDRQANVVHIGADGVAEEQHLHDRQRDEHGQRAAIAADVEHLLPQEARGRSRLRLFRGPQGPRRPWKDPGRATWAGELHEQLVDRRDAELRFRSAGAPMAAIRPATMIEMRSQYSASSM